MENMAAMLNEMAGGLQQSFGAVFERVGESLSQSAQMMQMMNEMMEAALLQSLHVTCDVMPKSNATTYSLHIHVANDSQIRLQDINVQICMQDAPSSDDFVIEGGVDARSSADLVIPMPSTLFGHKATIRLAVRSPGTQQLLYKHVDLRIPLLKIATIEAVKTPVRDATPVVTSEQVNINSLRQAFRISPFDPLLSAHVGHYRVALPPGLVLVDQLVLNVSIEQSGNDTRVVVSVNASVPSDTSVLEVAQALQAELEALA